MSEDSDNKNDSKKLMEKKSTSVWIILIRIIHFIIFLFILIAPFSDNSQILFLHAFLIPFLYLHWITNNNTCALTTLEKFVQFKINGKIEENYCFSCGIIDPVYNVTKDYSSYNSIIYGSTFSLWLVSVYKLRQKFKSGEVESWKQLAFPLLYSTV